MEPHCNVIFTPNTFITHQICFISGVSLPSSQVLNFGTAQHFWMDRADFIESKQRLNFAMPLETMY